MAAGFQGDIGRGAPRLFTGSGNGQTLGMRLAGLAVPAFAHHLAIAHQHAAHPGIGVGGVQALPGKLDGAGHVSVVFPGECHTGFANLKANGCPLTLTLSPGGEGISGGYQKAHHLKRPVIPPCPANPAACAGPRGRAAVPGARFPRGRPARPGTGGTRRQSARRPPGPGTSARP